MILFYYMANTSMLLINALKKRVRAAGFSYRSLAQGLGLSEPTIKRMFSGQRLTLDRLEAVSRYVGIELGDLIAEVMTPPKEVWLFSEEQERILSADLRLLAFTFMLL